MTLTIRDGAKGVTIRATGRDAARVRRHLALALAPEPAENGQEALPNAPKSFSRGTGAPIGLRIAQAVGSRRAR